MYVRPVYPAFRTAPVTLLLHQALSRFRGRKGPLPHEDWQVDFIHMPSCASFKLVLVDTITGWMQAEKMTTVARATLKKNYTRV